jgi:hypothetical protein
MIPPCEYRKLRPDGTAYCDFGFPFADSTDQDYPGIVPRRRSGAWAGSPLRPDCDADTPIEEFDCNNETNHKVHVYKVQQQRQRP